MIAIYPNEHQSQMTFNCCLDYKNLKPNQDSRLETSKIL